MNAAVMEALKGKKSTAKPKALKTFTAKEQSDGKYHVRRHSGKPNEAPVEHSAENMAEVQQALQEHMGAPEGAADATAPAPMDASA